MFSKEFLDVFLPCFAALWLICSIIAVCAIPRKDSRTGKNVPLYLWLLATLLAPITLGIVLGFFIEKAEEL